MAITVCGEIYGARGSSLYLIMTGTRDVTTCADLVYGKHFRTHFSQSFLLKMISWVPVPGRVLLENGICYRDSDFTVAHRVNSELQHGTNILISETCKVVGLHGHIYCFALSERYVWSFPVIEWLLWRYNNS